MHAEGEYDFLRFLKAAVREISGKRIMVSDKKKEPSFSPAAPFLQTGSEKALDAGKGLPDPCGKGYFNSGVVYRAEFRTFKRRRQVHPQLPGKINQSMFRFYGTYRRVRPVKGMILGAEFGSAVYGCVRNPGDEPFCLFFMFPVGNACVSGNDEIGNDRAKFLDGSGKRVGIEGFKRRPRYSVSAANGTDIIDRGISFEGFYEIIAVSDEQKCGFAVPRVNEGIKNGRTRNTEPADPVPFCRKSPAAVLKGFRKTVLSLQGLLFSGRQYCINPVRFDVYP